MKTCEYVNAVDCTNVDSFEDTHTLHTNMIIMILIAFRLLHTLMFIFPCVFYEDYVTVKTGINESLTK